MKTPANVRNGSKADIVRGRANANGSLVDECSAYQWSMSSPMCQLALQLSANPDLLGELTHRRGPITDPRNLGADF